MREANILFDDNKIIVTIDKQGAARMMAWLAIQMSRLEGIDTHDSALPDGAGPVFCLKADGTPYKLFICVERAP